MPNKKKKFALRADQLKPLVENRGGCIATDQITVDGRKVGYMYREEPHHEQDSGWVFMSGMESQKYMDEADNHCIFDVNTLANYDPDIIPFLDAPAGSAFERAKSSCEFQQVAGKPWVPGEKSAASAMRWPPPGFLLVQGEHPITNTWSIHLTDTFAQRVEDGQLVLWRPGFTIWLTAWENNHGETQRKRLNAFKKVASPERFDEQESKSIALTRYSYRLRDESEDGRVEAMYGFVFSDLGHLQLSFYFDDPKDEAQARKLLESAVTRNPANP